MTEPINDRNVWRRVALLEQRIGQLEALVSRLSAMRQTQPLGCRLWRFTLNEAMADGMAEADLLLLGGADTERDVTIQDPLLIFEGMDVTTGWEGWCLEQIDVNGTRWFVAIQGECPP